MAYSWWSGIKGPKIDPTKGGGAQFGFGSQGYGGGNGYGGGQERQKPVPPSFYDYDYSGVPMGEDAAQRLSQRYWSGLAGLGDFFSSYTAPRYMASVEGLMGMLTPEAAQARARERWDSSRSMRAQQASQARQTALLSGLSPEAAMDGDKLDALRQAACNIGSLVGRREAREARVYAVKDEDGLQFHTTSDNTSPGPWAFLVCSTGWIKRCYVYRVNEFCGEALAEALAEDMGRGREDGMKQYAEAKAAKDKLEALDKAAVHVSDCPYGTSACFKTRDDAKAWAESHAADTGSAWIVYYVAREHSPVVQIITSRIGDDSGEDLDGLWEACYVKSAPGTEPDAGVSGMVKAQ